MKAKGSMITSVPMMAFSLTKAWGETRVTFGGFEEIDLTLFDDLCEHGCFGD
jgi:hypothetical protein